MKLVRNFMLASVSVLATSQVAIAQDAPSEETADTQEVTEIIVTGVARGQNSLDTSVSVSSLGTEEIANASPRSVAELFRNLPGVRSESSGGEGNANIQVRGLPVASGGAKFLQLHEDGIPVLEFGDITFGNADIFLRSDFNVARVESIRGGSASTFASNSPGGIINLISKTGEREGGSLQLLTGLGYGEYRLDADYGGQLAEDLYFHVGGFYRQGEGPRDIGYDGNKGGQIKLNITKKFDAGYIRFFGKYLNDNAVGYLPNPVLVTGTNANPDYVNVPNFDINEDSLHSRNFLSATSLNAGNNPERFDIREGQHPVVKSFGFEANFDVAEGLNLTNRFRYSDVSGSFVSPFPGSIDTATNVAGDFGAGTVLRFANGANAGDLVGPASLVARIVLFNTRLNSLDNITNDLRLSKTVDLGESTLDLTAGFYKSRQDISTEWLWTSHLLEVRGGGDAALIDAFDAGGTALTDNGTVAYGASFFGNCCRRVYDVTYDTNAPFLSANFNTGGLTLDGSIRFDFGSAEGEVFGADLGGGRVGVAAVDVNGDGTISAAENSTSIVPLNQPGLVNYKYDYVSYSLGANYRFTDDLSAFARYSRGGRANADRILFNGNNIDNASGALLNSDVAIDFTRQLEIGAKYKSSGVQLYGTIFRATTEEENFEASTQTVFSRSYRATGIELEGSVSVGDFSLSAGATYTDAKITRDLISPGNEGNRPRRQADLIYQITPQYSTDLFTIGANIVGTTESFAQDNEGLVLPAFTQVNAFLSVRPTQRVQLSLNANNLFNTTGFTEAEEGSIPANGIVRARSINGRTISAAIKFDF
ncbi:TonB-dependent receptor domain-containing protein [Sphingorhabdus arenilitoris]|uniref:TonB-dependent receptor domain-containing protein n=1 Tax=Sphingorhabdus arenilitoris TaxID=1490041 RepID=A0ABV8RGH3_9SPHN